MKAKVTIIGFGNMGKAIEKALKKNAPKIKVQGVDLKVGNIRNVKNSDFIILSVKPQDAEIALKNIKKEGLKEKAIIISILAGFPIKKIQKFSGHQKVVRLMPNLGLAIGCGIAVWKGVKLSREEKHKLKDFLNRITDNFEVKSEDKINKVTAVSGSGPAYFFLLAEALLEALMKFGFRKEESRKLVEKTFLASAILQDHLDYTAMIQKIASKKGTTEAALKIFKKHDFNRVVSKAVQGAYQRAKELGK